MTAIHAVESVYYRLMPRKRTEKVAAIVVLVAIVAILATILSIQLTNAGQPNTVIQPPSTSQPAPRASETAGAPTLLGLDEPSEQTESVGWCIADPLEDLRANPNLRGVKYNARDEDMHAPYSALELKALKAEFVERLAREEAQEQPEPCFSGIRAALSELFAQTGMVDPPSLSAVFASPRLHLTPIDEQMTAQVTIFDRNSGEPVNGGTIILQAGELVWWAGTDESPVLPVMRYVGGDVLAAEGFIPPGDYRRQLELFAAAKAKKAPPSATTTVPTASSTSEAASSTTATTEAASATSTTPASSSTTVSPAPATSTTHASTTTQAEPRPTGSLACKDGKWQVASLSPAPGQGGIDRYTDSAGNAIGVGSSFAPAPNGTGAIVVTYYLSGQDKAGVMQMTSNGQTCP